MSLLVTAVAAVAVGLMAAGAAQGVRHARASTLALGDARRAVRDALLEAGAELDLDEHTVLVPWGERVIRIRVDSGGRARLVERDAPVPPRGSMMSIVLTMPSVRRLAHRLIKEWEPIGPGSWPGGAFPEAELCVALREQAALHAAMRHLLERWPMLGFTLDNDGTWEVYVSDALRAPDALRAFWGDLLRAAEAWEQAAPVLVDVATTVRGQPGAVALPPRPTIRDAAASVEGAPIAVPLAVRDD